jgi:putative membrane protein
MVSDHGAANEKLKGSAEAKNAKLPTAPSLGQRTNKTRLEALSGDTFDKSYVKNMIKDHEQDIKLFEKEATTGMDAEAKAYAAATLPTLQGFKRIFRRLKRSRRQ